MRVASICVLLFAAFASGADQPQFPVVRWSGVVADEKKQQAAKEPRIIADQKTFEVVWKAWRMDDPPQVNFDTHVVLALTMKAKVSFIHYWVTAEGELMYTMATPGAKKDQKEMEGFGYAIAVIPREGIKKFKGKPAP